MLTDFLLFNKPMAPGMKESPLTQPIWATESVTLDSSQQIFSVEFAALSYSAPKGTATDSDWRVSKTIGTKSTAAGAWRHIRVCRQESTFSMSRGPITTCFGTRPYAVADPCIAAVVANWWFRSLMGLAFGGLILGVYALRVNELKRREKVLKVMVRERTAELTEANQRRAEEARK